MIMFLVIISEVIAQTNCHVNVAKKQWQINRNSGALHLDCNIA